MKAAGLILAAGASSRMGTVKALLELEGRTFLDRIIEALAGECSPVCVVLGHHAEAIRSGLRDPDRAIFVENPQPERGQLSSLQCGLAVIPSTSRGVLFTPVDIPAIRPGTVAQIARRFAQGDAPLVIPRYENRRGHPVCLSRPLIDELLELSVDTRASDVIHRHLDEAVFLDVDDPAIVDDIDDPEAYQRLVQRTSGQ